MSIPTVNPAEITSELIAAAEKFDDDQAARAREFEREYERVMGKKLNPRTPITRKWFNKRANAWRHSACLPGRTMPNLVFGDKGIEHSGYIAIDRRFVLTNTVFGEVLARLDKIPRHNMVRVE